MISDPMNVALELAAQASETILDWFQRGTSVEVKADQSPVTEADLEVNAFVVDRLSAEFPDHGIIGEEASGQAKPDADYVWLCDPIDGTRPFAMGLPISTFSLALVHNGEPVLGVIAWPFRDWTFAAEVGKGTTLNGVAVEVDASGPFSRVADVMTARRLSLWVPGLTDELGESEIACVTLNSVAISAAFVACGRMGGAVWSGDTPWDAAAAKIIVEEAGGKFTDLNGADQRYDSPINGFVAGTPVLHEKMLRAVAQCGIKPGRRAPWLLTEHLRASK